MVNNFRDKCLGLGLGTHPLSDGPAVGVLGECLQDELTNSSLAQFLVEST